MCSFSEIEKVKKHIEKWDAELAWDSPNATRLIWLYGWYYGLEISTIRPIWTCLSVEVFAVRTKYIEPFVYCIVISYILFQIYQNN